MNESSLWWNGPLWFKQDPSVWPTWNTSDITPEVLEQVHSETRGPKTPIEMTTMVGIDKKRASRIQLVCLHWITNVLFSKNYYVFQCMCSSSSRLR